MKKELCVFCSGEMGKRRIDVTRNWGGKMAVFKNVPAEVCNKCGEVYFSLKTMKDMENVLLRKMKPESVIKVPVYSV